MHNIMVYLHLTIPPYFLTDKGYPLITWIMTPFKEEGQHTIAELLHN
jgi:hypothetical protein